MQKTSFAKLFEPARIGSMSLRNRIVMPPMGTGYGDEKGYVNQRIIDHYEARARGGVGLIIVENASVSLPAWYFHGQLLISDDSFIPGLRNLVDAVHRHGAKISQQLNHAGRAIMAAFAGVPPVAPSPIPTFTGEIPHELSVTEIRQIVGEFAEAARRAKEAGFDGVEIHAAHQYLIASFLSPATNARKDDYGGPVENRARFLIEILSSVRNKVGSDFPVWPRLDGQEFGTNNGITIEDTKQVVKMAVAAGAQAVHISAYGTGSYTTKAPAPDSPGFFLPLAAEVKKVTAVPVITVGRMDPELAEQALESGKADLVAMGRRLLSDPDLPNKIREGTVSDVNPCIGCMECLECLLFAGKEVICSVNPAVGKERQYPLCPANKVKKVVVVGSGPAGMTVARVAALRGHKVTLFEKESRLGGRLNIASLPPNKGDILPLVKYLAGQLEKAKVKVMLGTEATLDLITKAKPDAVVVASGGMPVILKVCGADSPCVMTAEDALSGKSAVGQNLVIIGGGMVGCETAYYMAQRGKQVTIVELLKRAASDVGPMIRRRLLDGLKEKQVTILTSAECKEIRQGGVSVKMSDGQERTVPADSVILAVGYKTNPDLFESLKSKVPELYLIGDSSQPKRIINAIDDGYRVGTAL